MWCYLGTVEPLDAEVAGYIVAGRSRPIRRRHHVRACRQHEGPTRNGGVLRHGRFVSPHPRLYLQATLPTPSHSSHDGPPALGNGREITDLIAAADPQGYRAFVSIAATNPSDTTAQGADVYTTSNPTTNGWSLANGNLPNPQQAPSAGVPAPRCERLAASPSDHNQVFCSLVNPDPNGRYYRVYRSVDGGSEWRHILNVSPDSNRNPDNNTLTLAQAGRWRRRVASSAGSSMMSVRSGFPNSIGGGRG